MSCPHCQHENREAARFCGSGGGALVCEAGRLRTPLDVTRARGFLRFVGRGDDMASLETALARTFDGHARVVAVVAEAGVGKSRLCYEFAELGVVELGFPQETEGRVEE